MVSIKNSYCAGRILSLELLNLRIVIVPISEIFKTDFSVQNKLLNLCVQVGNSQCIFLFLFFIEKLVLNVGI